MTTSEPARAKGYSLWFSVDLTERAVNGAVGLYRGHLLIYAFSLIRDRKIRVNVLSDYELRKRLVNNFTIFP